MRNRDNFNIKIGGEKGRARVIQLVISIVFQAKLKTPLFPPRQPCNQFVSSPRGSPRVRTPANCPRTLSRITRAHTRVSPIGQEARRYQARTPRVVYRVVRETDLSRSEMSSPRSSWTIDHFKLHHQVAWYRRDANDTRVSVDRLVDNFDR